MTTLTREIARKLFEEKGPEVVIPEAYTSIGLNAFSKLKITSVKIPASIKTIGTNAFAYNKLSSVVIPKGVTHIGWGAFIGNQLSSAIISESVTAIGKYAFNDNELTTIVIPKSVTSFGQYAFKRNPLTLAVVPENSEFDETFLPERTKIEYISNAAPNDLLISENSFDENILANSTIANIRTSDTDTDDSHTYSLEPGDGDQDNDKFMIEGDQLKIIESPDFEKQSSYSIRLKTSDSGNLGYQKSFTLTVNNLNERPSNISLSKLTFIEKDFKEPFIATLRTTDSDSKDSHTYSLESGNGDQDNDKFTIEGDQLKIIDSPDFETKSSYSIRLKTMDNGDLTFEKEFKLVVSDVNETEVNSIKSIMGKGILKGTINTDQFTFDQFDSFGMKNADRIKKFNPLKGDTIGVSHKAFPSLESADEVSFASASTKKELRLLSKENYDFIYFETNGRLFYNGNGEEKGWGNSDVGGVFAILKGKPELSADNFTLLA